MKGINKISRYIAASLFLVVASCADLDVKNPNNPDSNQVLGDPSQYPGVIGGSWNTWYYVESNPGAFTLAAIADQFSGSMNNFNINLYSSEPGGVRNGLNNSPTAANNNVINDGWDNAYSAIGGVNDVLRILKAGDVVVEDEDGNDITKMVQANGLLILGLSYGFLSEVYDRAFLIDENVADPTVIPYPTESNYKETLAFALTKLDEAIAILDAEDFTIPGAWLNTPTALTSAQLSRIANSYAARFIAMNARTSAEADLVDWNAVLDYTANGITEDFIIVGTGYGTPWVHEYSIYTTRTGWGRVDQRIVALLDDGTQPSNYPLDGTTNLGPVTTSDNRINTDFQFIATQWANPERGYWHFSNYRYKRLDPVGATFTGPHPFMRKAENDLLRAEAIIRLTGPDATVAGLINNSRVGRGNLSALTGAEPEADMIEKLFYERDIELMLSGSAISFCDLRRRDQMKTGSPIQIPIPGKELELLGQTIYTFPEN